MSRPVPAGLLFYKIGQYHQKKILPMKDLDLKDFKTFYALWQLQILLGCAITINYICKSIKLAQSTPL